MKRIFNPLIALIIIVPALLVSCKDNGGENINVNTTFSVTPSGNSLLSKETQTLSLTVSSTSAWNLSSNQNWITPGEYVGTEGRSSISFEIGENTGANSRIAVLTIKESGTYATLKSITVVQLGTSDEPAVKWIYDELKTSYYWNEAVQNAIPDPNPDPDSQPNDRYAVFLENLVANLRGAEDADGTMDGGLYDDGDRYVYSYVSRTPAATRAIDEDGMETTFGFGFYANYVSPTSDQIKAIVTWVRPGSPADGVLRRGMVIDRYQGNTINYSTYVSLFNQVYYNEGGNTMTLGIEGGQSHTLTAAYSEMTPILYSGTIESPVLKKKVAYLVYNEFETGPRNGNTYRFDDYIRSSFRDFAGADELVLDLRYNLGGYVSSCQVLTSLIANTATTSTIFAYLTYNSDLQSEDERLNFRNETNRLTTINKVYVLTTGNSASASEMVINALRGIDFEVIQIGERTEGKNVGMNLFEETIEGYDYEMWPITFKISNAKRFSDYANGFAPDYPVVDVSGFTTPVYEFGNPQEALLKKALAHIDGNLRAVFEDTRVGEETAEIPYPRPLPGGGARIPHPPGAETDAGE